MLYDPRFVNKRLKNVIHFPNKTYSKLELINKDYTKLIVEVRKEEADLLMELKLLYENKVINDKQLDNLVRHIDNYGSSRYDDGDFNANYEG